MGNLIWETQIPPNMGSGDKGQAIAVDSQDNIYVTGQYLNGSGNHPYCATFKLNNSNGNIIWEANWTKTNIAIGNDITVDNDDNVYVVGSFVS